MAGRPRKNAQRHPCGKIVQALQDSGYSPAVARRLIDNAARGAADAVFGTPLGRLHLEGKINATQFAAGKKWDQVNADYREAMQSPNPNPSATPMGASRSEPPDVDSERGQRIARRHKSAVQAFEHAHAVLIAGGMLTEVAVRSLCEDDGKNLSSHLMLLRARDGLTALANFWRLNQPTKSRKS